MNEALYRILPELAVSSKAVTWLTLSLRKFKRQLSDQKARHQFERESKRLLGTSPHLLKDIGLIPAAEPQHRMQQAWKAAPERPDIKVHTGCNHLRIQEGENSSLFDRPSVI
jgi:hypothetical protein